MMRKVIPDLCGGEPDCVSASLQPRNLLQDQSHSAGILPKLLHKISSAPAHLVQRNRGLFHCEGDRFGHRNPLKER